MTCSVCGQHPAVARMDADLQAAPPAGGAPRKSRRSHRGRQGSTGMAGKNGSRGDEEGKTGLVTKTRPKTKKPNLYKVLLLNDDYTPMEFVVHVLERFFNKS